MTCSCQQTPSIDVQVEQRTSEMIVNAQKAHSNADGVNVVVEATHTLEETATMYQSKIASILYGASKEAYLAEINAFSEWYAFQNTISEKVVIEIWELRIGGTAGNSEEVRHVYDRANSNALEQEILANALMKQSYATPYLEMATMEQILSAKEKLMDELHNTHWNVHMQCVEPHLADEIDAYLAQDLALFQKWLSARKVFESCLNKKVRVIFSSQTGYWLDLYLSTLKGEFID